MDRDVTSTLKIIKEICEAMSGDDCSLWNVGVTDAEISDLHGGGVPGGSHCLIHLRASCPKEAMVVAKAFWNLGCQAGFCGQGESAGYVFAFRDVPRITASDEMDDVFPADYNDE